MLTSGRVITKEFIPASGGHFDKREERERERERFAQIAFTLKTLTHHSPTSTHTLVEHSPTTPTRPHSVRSVLFVWPFDRPTWLPALAINTFHSVPLDVPCQPMSQRRLLLRLRLQVQLSDCDSDSDSNWMLDRRPFVCVNAWAPDAARIRK